MQLIDNTLKRSHKQLFILITAVSLCTLLPALFSGLMGDDLLHFMIFNHPNVLPNRHDFSLFNLFSFVSDNPADRLQLSRLSLLPWWVDPEFTWNFWRPLAEITHFIDYGFFGKQFWLMHLQSLLWFTLLLWLVYRWFLILFDQKKIALLAFALFALSASHAITVAWLSNRHAVLASCAIMGTLLLHHQWAQTHRKRYLLASTLLVACGFLSSELGLSAGVWLFCYSVFYDRRKVSARLLGLLPYLLVFLLWAYLYRLGDFGIRGYSSFYIDPFENPFAFLKNTLLNIPSIVLSQTLVIPADIFSAIRYIWIVFLGGLLVLLGLLIAAQKNADKKNVFFFLMAFLLLVIPISSSPAQDRNLLQVSIAFSGLLAMVLLPLYQKINLKDSRVAKSLFYGLLVLHFVISPLLTLPLSFAPQIFSQAGTKRAATLDINEGDRVLILKGDMMESTYLYPNLVLQGKPLPSRLWNIGGHQSRIEITQIDANTLQIKALTPFFSAGDLLARNTLLDSFENNDIDLDGLTIRVVSTTQAEQPKTLLLKMNGKLTKIFIQVKEGYIELIFNKNKNKNILLP